MATAAFKSTTRRTSVGDSTSGIHHRRSRSVSRFSHRIPAEDAVEHPSGNRRGKFVNTERGSGFPEISLDDLAIEMFSSSDFGERGRMTSSEASSVNNTASYGRRGRSVSRRGSQVGDLRNSGDKNGVSDGSSRRRRSLSVIPYQVSDSENEHFQKTIQNKQKPVVQKSSASYQQKGLRRSSSQRDFLRSHDSYSSYSSTVTDDEGIDAHYNANEIEKAMQAAYAQNKVMAENHRSELANDGLQSSDACKAVSVIRRNYRTKLEQSERRKQELLAEIMLEEERGKELKKIVGELTTNPKDTTAVKRPMRGRKKSNDRIRTTKKLAEDAEKIIEDFISSVEETDISSFDGERSDTSSIIGGIIKPMTQYGDIETFSSPMRSDFLPSEMDGVVLPWLKWETSNDGTPLSGNDNKQPPATPKTVLQDALEEVTTTGGEHEQSVNSKSSHGSWSPGGDVDSFSMETGEISRSREVDSFKSQILSRVPRKSPVDIDDYLKPPSNEDFLLERWKQRETINSGGLLICHSGCVGKFLL